MKQNNRKSLVLLLLTSMIWGAAFVAQSVGMDHVGPWTFLSLRSLLGGLILIPGVWLLDGLKGKAARPANFLTGDAGEGKELLKGGICAGAVLCGASALQQIGLLYTTAGKAGFLTALYILFVPFLGVVLLKQRLPKTIWFCVLLAVVGMALLCLNGGLALELGDGLELLCALVFSLHILVLDHFAPKVDPVRLSCLQFFVCGALAAAPMVLVERPEPAMLLNAWAPILYAGLLSSGVGYTLQAVAQRDCDPTLASLVMCLESVFSVLFGWLLLGQRLSPRELVGCMLMFVAIALANLPAKEPGKG